MAEVIPQPGGRDGGPKDHDPQPLPESLRVLYGEIADYAGWAEPSSNPLEVAVANFRHYRESGSNAQWALRNLVLRFDHLSQLDPSTLEGLPLSIVLTDADSGSSFATLEVLADAAEHGLNIRTVEMGADSPQAIFQALEHVPTGIFPYFEVPADRSFLSEIQPHPSRFGLKARIAGTDQTPVQGLAAFLAWPGPKKVTQSLHYPITGLNPDSGQHDYGNVNVAVATVAARMQNLWYLDIEQILREEDPAMFEFSDQGVVFHGDSMFQGATIEEIQAAREQSLHAIGTCNAQRIVGGLDLLLRRRESNPA